jgi:hypothetical protein
MTMFYFVIDIILECGWGKGDDGASGFEINILDMFEEFTYCTSCKRIYGNLPPANSAPCVRKS